MRTPEQERAYAGRLMAALAFLDEMRPAIELARKAGWTINVGIECADDVHRFNVSGEIPVGALEPVAEGESGAPPPPT